MNELSLFSGAGGGLLGTKLLGFNHIGYVEWDDYCQQVIAQRIKDGHLDEAPIFTDVREFAQSGAAREYRGFTDVVTGGFPCQPFSNSGKKKGGDDSRNMWTATKDIISEVRPKYTFLENVTGLLTHEYIRRIYGDLAEMGYNAKWGTLGGRETSGHCDGQRIWILAETIGNRRKKLVCCKKGISSTKEKPSTEKTVASNSCSRADRIHALEEMVGEPFIMGSNDALANQMDRLRTIGNGWDPVVAATAWQILTN